MQQAGACCFPFALLFLMDSDKTDRRPALSPSELPPTISLGMPPNEAELKKANWVLGLGVASFLCTCLSFVPALIIGLPLMTSPHAEVKSRIKLGLLLGGIALALNLLLAFMWPTFFKAAFEEEAQKMLMQNFGEDRLRQFKE